VIRRTSTLAVVAFLAALFGLAAPAPSLAATGTPGTPYTWGGNNFGQLGDGSTTNRLAAGPVSGLTDVVSVHGGREFEIALRSDGSVWVWGSNVDGALGLGGSVNRPTPTAAPAFGTAIAVTAGHNYSVVLRSNGTVWTSGLNSDGQLGDGTTTLRRTPVQVVGLTGIVAIAAGRDMTFALKADGTVMAWGRNDEGQLGDGTTTRRLTPVAVHNLTNVAQLVGGRDHGLAVRTDGSVWTWGSNDYGQLGDGTLVDKTLPAQVATGMTEVAAGAHHSYALRADGQVLAWGRNYRDEIGDGTTTQRTRPVAVIGVTTAVDLGSGRDHGVAVLADGHVMTWGYNLYGQLGDGTTTSRTRAIAVPGVTGAIKSGGGGEEYSVVLVGTGPPPNQPPVASFTSACTNLSCSFNGQGSSDPDGVIASYNWDLGGVPAVGQAPGYVFPEAGTYQISLTVTDDDGATDTVQQSLTVPTPANVPPVARFTFACVNLACSFDGGTSNDPDASIASYLWDFSDDAGALGVAPTHTFAAAGTYPVSLTVTDSDGATNTVVHDVAVTNAPPPAVTFRASSASDSNSTQPAVAVPGAVQTGDRLVLIVTTNRAATATTPPGWTLVGSVSDGTEVRSWIFTRAATTGLGGSTVRVTLDAISKTSLTIVAYAGAGAPSAVGAFEAGTTAGHAAPAAPVATAGSTVLRYWADKVSAAHGWTLPAGVTGRASTLGSGGGLLTSTTGDTSGVAAGTAATVTATAGASSAKAVSWTLVLPPA
jgi:alpha-tubulin suppressor-like RCC1 family protein/PKD repeat protein